MLNAEQKQFKIDAEGQILFQADATNPLPGQPVARLSRGQSLLQPDITVIDTNLLEGQDKLAIAEKLREWMKAHVATVLEPLMPLLDETGLEGAARGIAFQLHEALGIILRSSIEDLIATLDDTGRAALRARKVRLGPVLVFLPALSKPASVRLRALLWTLWNNGTLPAIVPNDGTTSVTVDPAAIDALYYRAIGYPVYGPRAIRVDMLDRLISAVYDNAKEGKFQATHSMAEWLGCSIPVLYDVLTSMGHTKLSDPAEEKAIVAAEAPAVEIPEAQTPVAESVAAPEIVAVKEVAVRPELATFRLRRGKASGNKPQDVAREPRERAPAKPRLKAFDKDWNKPPENPRTQAPRPEKKPAPSHHRPDRPARDNKRGKDDRADRPERVISARPDTQGASPFAALKGLKLKSKDD